MPQSGGLVGDFDVAQLMVILFVLFFVGLVLHLRQEDKREGYPLKDPAGGPDQEGFPPIPKPKTFLLMDGDRRPHPTRKSSVPLPRDAFPTFQDRPLSRPATRCATGSGRPPTCCARPRR